MFVLNVFMYLLSLFNQPLYQEFKDAGYPCYGYLPTVSAPAPTTQQPVCFYDPSNTNPAQ